MTITKALVPVDFSSHSETLVKWLPTLKKMGVKKIWFLHVLDELKIEHPVAGYDIGDIMKQYIDEAESKLNEYRDKIKDLFEEVNICTIWAGDPAIVIVKQADELNADIIVMATGGKGWFKELILGSTSRKVAQLSNKPVLLVKKEWMESRVEPNFDHILVSTWLENPDDEQEVKTLTCTLENAKNIAQSIYEATGAKPYIRVFIIVTKIEKEIVGRAKGKINAVFGGFKESVYDSIIWTGDPVEDLIKAAISFDADIVVVGSKGSYRGFSLGFRLTSLLSKIDIPIYVCK
ncbi:MAG: universal stress protein [Desulfurococcales archaeon]|nr:universal stress protein [Desulfurococcales archaeon]